MTPLVQRLRSWSKLPACTINAKPQQSERRRSVSLLEWIMKLDLLPLVGRKRIIQFGIQIPNEQKASCYA